MCTRCRPCAWLNQKGHDLRPSRIEALVRNMCMYKLGPNLAIPPTELLIENKREKKNKRKKIIRLNAFRH